MRYPANRVTKPTGFGEKVLAWQPLQLLSGMYGQVAIGGHLEVTPDELVFQPHAMNLSTEVLRIPRSAIVGLRKKQSLAAALLVVSLSDGREERFVSWKRDEIIGELGGG
ncbi:hypothetical protein HW450_08750 [Corynebacterium hindlerae]|uniref:GRAM domain-containing protein n=1 Tax=Corynebacterium hindlerae TaxID=699041 RepID=A0A7G5FCW1_9CORY|nr:hypothetical protein [Corynebacterium hindlerae]QMV84452.1 hypothetical protein HW450_08750 [Corynebacterium hindlerae]